MGEMESEVPLAHPDLPGLRGLLECKDHRARQVRRGLRDHRASKDPKDQPDHRGQWVPKVHRVQMDLKALRVRVVAHSTGPTSTTSRRGCSA